MQTHKPRLSARRLWAIRLGMVVVSSLIGLVLADRIVGLVFHTSKRHSLRLPANLSYRHRSGEFDYVFNTNARGLRGPDIPIERPTADTYRIALLGDSFVAGFGVADEDVMTNQLARILSNEGRKDAQVINLGRVGSSTIRELEVYETLGRPYRPDVVVLMFSTGNDLREIVEERDREERDDWRPGGFARRLAYALFPNLYLELAIWKQQGETRRRLGPRSQQELLGTVDRLARQFGADPELARKRYLALPPEARAALEQGTAADTRLLPPCFDPSRLKRAIDPDDRYFRKAWPRVERHLELIRQAVAADGGKLVICVIPDAVQVDEDAYRFVESLGYDVEPEWTSEPSRTERALQRWTNRAGVPYLDLTDELRGSSAALYYPKDGHFNPAGHAKAAEALAEFLAANKLLPGATDGKPAK